MKEAENPSQDWRDQYFKNLNEALESYQQEKIRLKKEFDRLWQNLEPLIIEKLKVKTDFFELYKSQIQDSLINPEEWKSEQNPTVLNLKEDGNFEFILPEVNERTIIETAKKFRDQADNHFREIESLPAEELEKIPHLLTLLYELGIIEVINQRFKIEGKDTATNKARLIGTIIGRTEKKQVEDIRKYLSTIDLRGKKGSPINETSIKEVTKVLIEYGLQIENL